MKKINGAELYEIMKVADEQGVRFKIEVASVQGLKGVYIFFEDFIAIGESYANCLLIEEL